KGKKHATPQDEEPLKKKRSTRSTRSGEGGSGQQQQQPPQQEHQREAFVARYPYLAVYEHSCSDKFYLEVNKK
ncbi:hypothetical protein A2U01_0075517, partial [Trifolium medium]|nr:hypothetical protein [Trifolium medium]